MEIVYAKITGEKMETSDVPKFGFRKYIVMDEKLTPASGKWAKSVKKSILAKRNGAKENV